MTPERWRQVDELFRRALERPAEERPAFLEAACGGDAELRGEVASLLEAHGEAGDFLEAAVGAEAEEMLRARAAIGGLEVDRRGQRIGAYEVVHPLGRGGMGAVYLGVRADRRFRKRVAIKVLKPGLATEEVVRRFFQERQILAGLDHPNIARLLDAATSDDGLPCFVMEHVEGVPIDAYCRGHGLSLRARLELFRTVCSAVQAAHQSLVVHRDLKPSNILVTSEGVPKLLDFGIAKPLDPAAFPQTVVPTAAPLPPMTPECASPEQVRGEAVTTASDVYALGVLLYLLLAGRPPYRLESRRAAEVERVICEHEPEPPSVAATAAGEEAPVSPGRLAGDLDTVVLKALAKEAGRRYGTVEQLSEDLRRYLEGLPILARRPTFGYRAGKLLRRHRAGAAAAAMALLMLLAGVAATAWQARVAVQERQRAEAERRLAEAERQRAEVVSAFLEELFQVPAPSRALGEAVTARELLDRGAAELGGRLDDQGVVKARLLDSVGRSYQGLGLYREAAGHLEAALELRRSALGDHPEVAESLNNLAEARRAMGELGAAEPLLRESLAMKRRLLGDEHPSVAVGLNNLAGLLVSRGEHAAAEPLFRQALELRRRLLGEEHAEVAEGLNNLALVRYRLGDLEAAEDLFRQALELRRRLLGAEHPAVARALGNLATVLRDRGELEAAEPLLRESLAMKRRLLPAGHPSLATTALGLGRLLLEKGDLEAARPLLEEAVAIRREALGGGWPAAEAERALAAWLAAVGRPAEAEPLLRRSLGVLEAELGPGDARVEAAREQLAALER